MSSASQGISRREFLTQGVCAAGLAAAASAAGRPGKAAGKRRVLMHFGFTTFQWGKDWDIPTLIANCQKVGVFGVELRTSSGYAHGVELQIDARRRAEVKKIFADSAVKLVGLASSEKFDWLDPAKVRQAIENTKAYLQLSRDIGASGVRVFVNDYHKEVPREKTIQQVADALNALGPTAADLDQQVRLEAHGSAGDLASIRQIMDRVTQPRVRVKINSLARDAEGKGFEFNFNLVKKYLGDTLHLHDLKDPKFPNQLQIELLVKMGWKGWALLEASSKVPDRVQALQEQRELWDRMVAKAAKA
jgi:hypothetical protein